MLSLENKKNSTFSFISEHVCLQFVFNFEISHIAAKMKFLLFLTLVCCAWLSVEAAASISRGQKRTSKCLINCAILDKTGKKNKIFFSVCKRGNCIDYCDIEKINLEPGEKFEEDCAIIKCGEDFSVYRESCGVHGGVNCTFSADYSLKYPGLHIKF